MMWAYIQTLGALLLVLLLMVVLAYAFRRWALGSHAQRANAVRIEVLGSTMLQPKVFVYVIRIEKKTFAVGVTERGMEMLTELEYQVPAIEGTEGNEAHEEGTGFPSFLQYLKNNLGFVQVPSGIKAKHRK